MKVFISYSREDKSWLNKFKLMLSPLTRKKVITLWYNEMNLAETRPWEKRIDEALDSARVAVLLVSPAFFGSDFIMKKELPLVLEKEKRNELKILWVPISPSMYHESEIANFQSAGDPNRPLDTLQLPEKNEKILSICKTIKDLVTTSPVELFDREAADGADVSPELALAYRFFGRDKEIEEARSLLLCKDVRLLTLTGTGGIGKTLLGYEVARTLFNEFFDGVNIVHLANLTDPAAVAATIGKEFDIQEAGRPAEETLKDYLREKRVLLVLDNFEHILGAVPLIGELIAHCQNVKILATSRVPLRLKGEYKLQVLPLDVPASSLSESVDDISQCSAVQLFVDRATIQRPDFSLTNNNAPPIAAICKRLDGLPLAIELTAAWINILSPQAILERLESALSFLTKGSPSASKRLQTIEASITWSYKLLNQFERRIFRRLSVFTGGCTLPVVELVCSKPGDDILSAIGALVDHNLVRCKYSEDKPRFEMLYVIRKFGQKKLNASKEAELIRHRYAGYFLGLAEKIEPKMGKANPHWLARFDTEYDNFRSVLDWCRNSANTKSFKSNSPRFSTSSPQAIALRVSASLGQWWYIRGHFGEGRRWLDWSLRITSKPSIIETVHTPAENPKTRLLIVRAHALHWAGYLAYYQNDYTRARNYFSQSHDLFEKLADERGIAVELGALSRLAYDQGDLSTGRELQNKSLRLFRKLADSWGIAWSLGLMVREVLSQCDYNKAIKLLDESLRLRRELNDKRGIAWSLHQLGLVNLALENFHNATELLNEALALRRDIGDKRGIASSMHDLGKLASRQNDFERSALLFALAESLRGVIGAQLPPQEREACDRDCSDVSKELDEKKHASIQTAAKKMSLQDAIAYALQ